MKLFVPKEIQEHERRVAATPETVKKFITAGFEVFVESDAGLACSIFDDQFEATGAKVTKETKDVYAAAQVVLNTVSVEGGKVQIDLVLQHHADHFPPRCGVEGDSGQIVGGRKSPGQLGRLGGSHIDIGAIPSEGSIAQGSPHHIQRVTVCTGPIQELLQIVSVFFEHGRLRGCFNYLNRREGRC